MRIRGLTDGDRERAFVCICPSATDSPLVDIPISSDVTHRILHTQPSTIPDLVNLPKTPLFSFPIDQSD